MSGRMTTVRLPVEFTTISCPGQFIMWGRTLAAIWRHGNVELYVRGDIRERVKRNVVKGVRRYYNGEC